MGMDRIDPKLIRGAEKVDNIDALPRVEPEEVPLVPDNAPFLGKLTEKLAAFVKDESAYAKLPDIDIDKAADALAETFKTLARSAAISLSVMGGAAARSPEVRIHPREAHHRIERHHAEKHFYSPADFLALAKNVINEAANQPTLGQIAVMQVTLARVASRAFGNTIHDVVYEKNQFSWTGDERGTPASRDPRGLLHLIRVLTDNLHGRSPSAIVLQLSALTGLPPDALWYKRTDWNENDPHDPHLSAKARAFFRKLDRVGTIGDHSFYALPQRISRR